jgi:hypothetical protein
MNDRFLKGVGKAVVVLTLVGLGFWAASRGLRLLEDLFYWVRNYALPYGLGVAIAIGAAYMIYKAATK